MTTPKKTIPPGQWETVAKGVRARKHPTRKNGAVKLDQYFTLRYTAGGKQVEHKLGWASEGWDVTKACAKLQELRDVKSEGGPDTIKEIEQAKRHAAQKAAKAEQDEARRNVTLSTYYIESYKPWAEATKPKAVKREDDIWRNWLKAILGDTPINAIGVEQWDHLVKTISATELSKRTNKRLSDRSKEYITGALRRILKHARERGAKIDAPPTGRMIGVTAPKNNHRQRILTDKELQTLLAKLRERDIHAWRYVMFVAGTGCRASEAFNLRWRNVNLKEGTVTFTKTKNTNSRTVPLGKELKSILKALTAGKPQEHVFLGQQGEPYKAAPAAFLAVVEEMKLNEGREPLDRFTLHILRHMAATRLSHVLPLRGLMDVMGWKVAAMALRYSHTSEADRKIAADTLDRAFHTVASNVKQFRKRGS